jgi:hypothetical protein
MLNALTISWRCAGLPDSIVTMLLLLLLVLEPLQASLMGC